jgi:hypothetical protein
MGVRCGSVVLAVMVLGASLPGAVRAGDLEDGWYGAFGVTAGVLAIDDLDEPFLMVGTPVRIRLMPIAFQFGGEFSREEYYFDEGPYGYYGHRDLYSLDASMLFYPIPPMIPVQIYGMAGGHLFYASYRDYPDEYGGRWDDDYGNGYHLGAGLDIQMGDVIFNIEARRLWVNEDKWGVSDREGIRFCIGFYTVL